MNNLLRIIMVLCLIVSGHHFLPAQDLDQMANQFLKSLDPELRQKASFPFDGEERFNMNFVPIKRQGPTFHDFNEEQKKAALALLRASVSEQGYDKAVGIMELEKVLHIMENEPLLEDGTRYRDPLNYHFCIFGVPGKGLWGWRFEGHHVSLNFASTDGLITASTPSFFGSNPGKVPIREQYEKEVLKMETELGFRLINALDDGQQKQAIIMKDAPPEIFTTNKRKVEGVEQKGIYYDKLSAAQKAIFMELLSTYVDNYQLGFASTLRAKIEKAGMDNLSFAWAGSLQRGKGHYYRIQGPTLLIEYDNVQNNANHVHSVVRDLTNDFAEDILRRHYENNH